MVLKVSFLKDKNAPNTSLTDWAKLGAAKNPHRLLLPDIPSILVRPKGEQDGIIRYHGKKLNLSKDNTFFYGAWPQKRVLPAGQEKLNQALLKGKLRSHYGHYYTLNGQACQEYLFEKKLYVLIKNKAMWMEVLPVCWQMDEQGKRAYTTQVVIGDCQQSPNFLGLVGQQILQSNKYLRETALQTIKTYPKRDLKSTLLHTLRALRDIETQEGKVSPEIQQAYSIFMKKVQNKRRVK